MAKLSKDQLKQQATALGLSFTTKSTVAELESMIANAETKPGNEPFPEDGEY